MDTSRTSKIMDALFDCLVDSIGVKAAVEELATNYLPDITDDEIYHLLRGHGAKYLVLRRVNDNGQPYVKLQDVQD